MFEKEAEEYVKANNLEWELECHRTSPIGEVNQAFQKGAEFGFQKGIKTKINTTTISDCPIKNQWHKVSEQIPTEEKDYIVKLSDGTVDVMTVALDGNLEPYLLTPEFDFYKDVEKWCEIPKELENV